MAVVKTVAHLHAGRKFSKVNQTFQSSSFFCCKIPLLEFNDTFFFIKISHSFMNLSKAITSGVNMELHKLSYVAMEHSVIWHLIILMENTLIFPEVVKFSIRFKFFKHHLLSLVNSNDNSVPNAKQIAVGWGFLSSFKLSLFVILNHMQWCGSHHILTLLTHWSRLFLYSYTNYRGS